ncbi:laccase-like isoform X2 [Venturia canescens]|uniref:laccase-like isoform X2 n=1 Tax=Venturia canescens TaxID=32260 RepID=UPI001C9CDD17|nr:laccase-like isoform X2 [Venturia canescens]
MSFLRIILHPVVVRADSVTIVMGPLFFKHTSVFVVVCFVNFAICGKHHEHSRRKEKTMSTPEECARECVFGAEPKTCYYHFTVEYYTTMSSACNLCRTNSTNILTEDCQCIMADGFEKSGIITANRMHPGPSIQVCLHDYVVVDVLNHVIGSGITIHWHGIYQNGYQHYDGVPFVTQCPIQEGSTFRYQWQANNAGTHFWHAHSGLHKAEGLDGSLIVRTSRTVEPNANLWDFDHYNNVIFLNDWLHDSAAEHYPGTLVRRNGQRPDTFLINGMGQYTDPVSGNTTDVPLAEFTVKKGHRYRFRMINACTMTCPIMLSVEEHRLMVIATDGENIEPVLVDSIVSLSAERYDFIITTDKKSRNYWIQARGLGECADREIQQLGILRYISTTKHTKSNKRPTYEKGIKFGLVLNQLNVQCNDANSSPHTLCVSNLRNARPIDSNIIKAEPDVRLYMPINFYDYSQDVAFESGQYRRFLVAGGTETVGLVANIANVLPVSPLLTQRKDIPETEICSSTDLPARCKSAEFCECTHVEELPLGAIIEIVLVDEAQIPGMSHPFHLHGHSFYIIGQGCASEYNITSIDVDIAKQLDQDGKMERHLSRPPSKDTYAVPNNGFTIIRMVANNPGLSEASTVTRVNSGRALAPHRWRRQFSGSDILSACN